MISESKITKAEKLSSDHKWLDKWKDKLLHKNVLELGCGPGLDSVIISQYANSLVACDINPPKLSADIAAIVRVDHSAALPFVDKSFDVVVASLCLHYFNRELTAKIIAEISRVLNDGGLLICRVNSTLDVNYGAEGYPEIEEGLYCVKNSEKRFFDQSDVFDFFSDHWQVLSLALREIDRYERSKSVWEFGARRLY